MFSKVGLMGNIVIFVGAVLHVTAHTDFTDCKEANVAHPPKTYHIPPRKSALVQ